VDSWFHRTFGVAGPFISSIFGILIFSLAIWVLSFMNSFIGSSLISGIHGFLLFNIGWFFLIFLFFSYTSYFSRVNRKAYLPFTPLVTAVGAVIVFWMVFNAINISNIFIGNQALQGISYQISANIFWIFCFFLLVGFAGLAAKIGYFQPSGKALGGVTMARPARVSSRQPAPGMRRLYRSGNERILGGVCGGIAEYFDVDP